MQQEGHGNERGRPQAAGEKGRLGRRAETLAGEQFSREETAGKEKSQFVKVYFYKLAIAFVYSLIVGTFSRKIRGIFKKFFMSYLSL